MDERQRSSSLPFHVWWSADNCKTVYVFKKIFFNIAYECDRCGGKGTMVDMLKLILFIVVNQMNYTYRVQIPQSYIISAQDSFPDAGKTS